MFDTKAKPAPFRCRPSVLRKNISIAGADRLSAALTLQSELVSERGLPISTSPESGWRSRRSDQGASLPLCAILRIAHTAAAMMNAEIDV